MVVRWIDEQKRDCIALMLHHGVSEDKLRKMDIKQEEIDIAKRIPLESIKFQNYWKKKIREMRK